MIWATVSSLSCFCWLYRASLSLAAKNIIDLISMLTIWWCPCVDHFQYAWFMDLTCQVPMQYFSLQHQTLHLSPVISTTGYWFCFGSIPSFFLEWFHHWSPLAYWAPTDLGSSSFSVLHVCLFIVFMGFSRQEYEVVCHSLIQWTTFCQTSPPWPVCLGWPL